MSNTQISPPDQAFSNFILNLVRPAAVRAKLDASELASVGLALSHGWISAEGAVAWLSELGLDAAVLGDELPVIDTDTGAAA